MPVDVSGQTTHPRPPNISQDRVHEADCSPDHLTFNYTIPCGLLALPQFGNLLVAVLGKANNIRRIGTRSCSEK